MRAIIAAIILAASAAAGVAFGQTEKAIVPVDSWPTTVTLADKIIYNASQKDCVKAGYRLKPAKPATPNGKQIKSETLVQDPNDPAAAQYVIVYEDVPVVIPPVIVSEVLTNITASRVSFLFTTNGVWNGSVIWTDAPKSNSVVVK